MIKIQSFSDIITNSSSEVFVISTDKHAEVAEFIKNVAFGAHFIKNLRDSKIKTWLYDEQSFSKNIILTPNKVQITPSSFDLSPIQIIEV